MSIHRPSKKVSDSRESIEPSNSARRSQKRTCRPRFIIKVLGESRTSMRNFSTNLSSLRTNCSNR